ncbi:mechanosensitive ion channel domain-containing protein [Thalassotalea maritima]|uniref:mechanosensitive ion channel domain-containing protein n=1 Tax=Thalassotalea maritima TaxID=3242416 RepID=UPI003529C99A
MENLLQHFSLLVTNKIFITIAIIIVIRLITRMTIAWIKRDNDFLNEKHRKWISRSKNLSVIAIIVMLVSLWWTELQTFALSIAAIAAAIVIASKELILCFSGSVLRASSHSFSIGDWIKVGNNTGEVIEYNMMSTVIQEIDFSHNNYNYTGKTVTLPNSLFLAEPVHNMNFMNRYVYHTFSIHCDTRLNVFRMRDFIFERVSDYSKEFMEVGRRYNAVIEKRLGVDLPGEEPHIRITTTETANFIFTITIFCPTEQAVSLEQHITQDYMEYRYQQLQLLNTTNASA